MSGCLVEVCRKCSVLLDWRTRADGSQLSLAAAGPFRDCSWRAFSKHLARCQLSHLLQMRNLHQAAPLAHRRISCFLFSNFFSSLPSLLHPSANIKHHLQHRTRSVRFKRYFRDIDSFRTTDLPREMSPYWFHTTFPRQLGVGTSQL